MTVQEMHERQAHVIELPLAQNIELLRPEHVVLKIDSEYRDVGAFVFAERSRSARGFGQAALVNPDTLLPHRRESITKLICALSSMLVDGGRRPRTLLSFIDQFKLYMDWCDSNGYRDCLLENSTMRESFRAYVEYVADCFARNKFQSSTANQRQSVTAAVLEAISGIEDLRRGIRFVRPSGGEKILGGTTPTTADQLSRVVSMNHMIFEGLHELVVGGHHFPYKLKVPSYLAWPNPHLWIFPSKRWHMPPHLLKERHSLKRPNWVYDYENGRLASIDEIWMYSNGRTEVAKRAAAEKKLADAAKLINRVNSDRRNGARLKFAMKAHNAFLVLFVSITGVNFSVAREIRSDDVVDSSADRQGYRAIKFRAGGKVVPVECPLAFMPSLRKYLSLRDYILEGDPFPYLFLSLGTHNSDNRISPKKIEDAVFDNHHLLLKKIDPDIPLLRPRKLRATVDDWYIRNHNATISSQVMGHSEKTALEKYGRGSKVEHEIELTAFLNLVSEAAKKQPVLQRQAEIAKGQALEEGGFCQNYGNPAPIDESLPVYPDCSGGCWFCSHRTLVAGEEDARKVASAMFVMRQLLVQGVNDHTLMPLIKKCESDLDSIAGVAGDKGLVDVIKSEVENGDLTQFWERKFEMFLEFGVVS